jgi:hypothetical protein
MYPSIIRTASFTENRNRSQRHSPLSWLIHTLLFMFERLVRKPVAFVNCAFNLSSLQDIRATPFSNAHVHPTFVRDCSRAIILCPNLESLVYTPNSLASLLPALQEKTRLKELRADGRLTTDQAEKLLKLNKLWKLVIDFGSWNVLDLLPRWTEVNQKTLTSLTIYVSVLFFQYQYRH